MKTKFLFVILFACAAVAATSAQTDNQEDKRIRFKSGESSATVTGGVPRGETVSYILKGKKNQTMTVKVSSTESNAVFKIKNRTTGYFLPGAGEYDDASSWEGTLPSDGDYRIIVGSTRGGTEYTLIVTIH